MLTSRLAQAPALAIEAHAGQVRKGTNNPYISHPMAVAAIALEHGADEEQAIAALLHDAEEDGGAHDADRIRSQFGQRVADIVDGCTDGIPDATGEKENWLIRKQRHLVHLTEACDDVLLVSGADKLHNARAFVGDLQNVGLAVFDRFNASVADTVWSCDELAKVHSQRGTPVAAGLRSAADRIQQLAQRGR